VDARTERVVPAAPTDGGPIVEALGADAGGEPAGEAGFETRRLSAMRKTIARRLTEAKQQVPHFYLRVRVRMDELLAVRTRLNAGLAEEGREVKISVNDFIVRAAALALRDVPAANVQFAGDSMRVFDRVDVSVAVATDGGLVTPVVRDADRLGLVAVAEEVRALAALAREGRLKPEQYQGGTFTVSNLGMYGIETVYPILNPPQACILGVGAADEQPVVRDREIVVGHVAAFTLAADHRAVDGAVGAQLLAAIRDRLEDPMGMML
jgi:pyruvate dehydrogenase E2 component (dihydrolipoamide acetyltransferase)